METRLISLELSFLWKPCITENAITPRENLNCFAQNLQVVYFWYVLFNFDSLYIIWKKSIGGHL